MIDEKGKLFGKINIIDLLVILLILVVAVVLGIRLLGKSAVLPSEGAGTQIEYTVKVTRLDPKVYDAIKAHIDGGETQFMASGEMLSAHITGVTATPYVSSVETSDGRVVTVEDPNFLDVVFSIRATVANPTTRAVGPQEVRVGKSHIVKTLGIEVTGMILTCDVVDAAA